MEIPINLERVLLRAAKDAAFCHALKSDRSRALQQCGYDLRPTELAMLSAMPWDALRKVIERFQPDRLEKSRFAKRVAAAVASSVLLSTTACVESSPAGVRPDDPNAPGPGFHTGGTGAGPDWPAQVDSGTAGAGGMAGPTPEQPLPTGGLPPTAGTAPDFPFDIPSDDDAGADEES